MDSVPRFFRALLAVVVVAGPAAGCMRPVATARTSPLDPPTPRELEAEIDQRHRSCDPRWGLLFPGLGQLCLGQAESGLTLSSLAAAEIATAVYVASQTDNSEHPGIVVPLVGVQDLWVYGLSDVGIRGALARRDLYAPQDTLGDLIAAPFNGEVMARPAVWGGLAGALAVGITATLLLESNIDTSGVGDDANLFGEDMRPEVGYPIAAGTGTVLFSHVAIAEEALFRGYLQSMFARSAGETQGWLAATALFGLAHVPNAWAVEGDERRDYLLYGIPIITAAGGYLGWLYRSSGYSLASPVAVHFWYDLLLSATFFALEPDNSMFSAKVSLPL